MSLSLPAEDPADHRRVLDDPGGKARVLRDTCVHRGGSLGGPWELGQNPRIVNGCVVCSYHGWEFGGDGECKNIPSIGCGKLYRQVVPGFEGASAWASPGSIGGVVDSG